MSLVLERRASKDEILELYLNDVYLGQRGSFAIHGVAEASRIFFGKDVANSRSARRRSSPASFRARRRDRRSPIRSAPVERRNVVLQRDGRRGDTSPTTRPTAPFASRCRSSRAASTTKRPYFVDMVAQQVERAVPRSHRATRHRGRLHHARPEPAARRARRHARRAGQRGQAAGERAARSQETAQAALLAVDPRTGEILALVGGRSYNQSQYNRVDRGAAAAGIGVQAVRLPRGVRARRRRRADRPHAGVAHVDEPAVFSSTTRSGSRRTTTTTTARSRCAARWPCRATSARFSVGERIGFDKIASLWKKVGVGTPPKGYPSITLGVFELTPLEVAAGVYALHQRRLGATARRDRSRAGGHASAEAAAVETADTSREPTRRILVTNMMRSVLNEGTGAARARPASPSMPPARAARPTTCAMRGSSGSRPSCSRWCGWASTTISRSA